MIEIEKNTTGSTNFQELGIGSQSKLSFHICPVFTMIQKLDFHLEFLSFCKINSQQIMVINIVRNISSNVLLFSNMDLFYDI